jgi:ubiquinone/menaquinone biosynthesis C-methylase UbiE
MTTGTEARLPSASEDVRDRDIMRAYFDSIAPRRDAVKPRNRCYQRELRRLVRRLVPKRRRVLEIGCGTGDLLAELQPSRGVGVDFSSKMIEIARLRHPELTFFQADAEELPRALQDETFDSIVLSDIIGTLTDILTGLKELRPLSGPATRIIITYAN